MRFGVLGTGMVGQALASKLVAVGHEVTMGSRQAGAARATEWVEATGGRAGEGSFADAARFGEAIVNATAGTASLAALASAGADNLAGKVLIDVANPIDHSQDSPAILAVCNSDCLGEQIQREHPQARVVKTLNTMNAQVMVEPGLVPGSHTVFVCGDDSEAKGFVTDLLESFGWPRGDVLDLGDISAARGTEMYLALWLRLWRATGSGRLNVKVVAE